MRVKDIELADVIQMMEERKKSTGLYETRGMIDNADQIRGLWMSLDLDLEEVVPAINNVILSVMVSCIDAIQAGMPPTSVFAGLYADAFSVGVMYERLRQGTI